MEINEEVSRIQEKKSAYFQGIMDSLEQFGVFHNPRLIKIKADVNEETMVVPFFGNNNKNQTARFVFGWEVKAEAKCNKEIYKSWQGKLGHLDKNNRWSLCKDCSSNHGEKNNEI